MHLDSEHYLLFGTLTCTHDWRRYRLPLNRDFQGTVLDEGSMTRTGGVGSGAAVFTEDQKNRWAAAEEEAYRADPELLAFARRTRTGM